MKKGFVDKKIDIEENFFDNKAWDDIKKMTKENLKKIKCNYPKCGKPKEKIKFYVIGDDLENSKPYHPSCIEKFRLELLIKLCENK